MKYARAAVDAADASVVCIATLPPGGLAHARYLCKRLRAADPNRSIVLLRPGDAPGGEVIEGATRVTTLSAARAEIDRAPQSPPEVDRAVVRDASAGADAA